MLTFLTCTYLAIGVFMAFAAIYEDNDTTERRWPYAIACLFILLFWPYALYDLLAGDHTMQDYDY